MREIRSSDVFIKWLAKLRDERAKFRIHEWIKRLAEGNPGDSRFLGDVSEMRIDYGPGYRVYFMDTREEIITLFYGGDKATQQTDISKARKIARLYEEEYYGSCGTRKSYL